MLTHREWREAIISPIFQIGDVHNPANLSPWPVLYQRWWSTYFVNTYLTTSSTMVRWLPCSTDLGEDDRARPSSFLPSTTWRVHTIQSTRSTLVFWISHVRLIRSPVKGCWVSWRTVVSEGPYSTGFVPSSVTVKCELLLTECIPRVPELRLVSPRAQFWGRCCFLFKSTTSRTVSPKAPSCVSLQTIVW